MVSGVAGPIYVKVPPRMTTPVTVRHVPPTAVVGTALLTAVGEPDLLTATEAIGPRIVFAAIDLQNAIVEEVAGGQIATTRWSTSEAGGCRNDYDDERHERYDNPGPKPYANQLREWPAAKLQDRC